MRRLPAFILLLFPCLVRAAVVEIKPGQAQAPLVPAAGIGDGSDLAAPAVGDIALPPQATLAQQSAAAELERFLAKPHEEGARELSSRAESADNPGARVVMTLLADPSQSSLLGHAFSESGLAALQSAAQSMGQTAPGALALLKSAVSKLQGADLDGMSRWLFEGGGASPALGVLADLRGREAEFVRAAVREENFLGQGGNAVVYGIPGADQYVLRVPKGELSRIKDGTFAAKGIQPVQDLFPEVNLGQAVARIGGVRILRRQEGVPGGLPIGSILRTLSEEKKLSIYREHLERAAAMPQSAYDELARNLRLLNSRRYQFDPSKSNNLLLDARGGRINIVDVSPMDRGSTYQDTLVSMVIPLMANFWAGHFKEHQDLTALRRIILEKSLSGSKTAGLPLPPENSSSLEYSFTLSGREGGWPAARALLARREAEDASPILSNIPPGAVTADQLPPNARVITDFFATRSPWPVGLLIVDGKGYPTKISLRIPRETILKDPHALDRVVSEISGAIEAKTGYRIREFYFKVAYAGVPFDTVNFVLDRVSGGP